MTRIILPTICVYAAVTFLAACGGGSSGGAGDSSGGAVAQVGDYAITKAMLNQWMTEKVGEGYYEVATHQAPPGLVAEPANYPACVATLKAITPIPGEGRPQPQPTIAQLTSKCRELYQAIKVQALSYLVSSYWSINFDADHGIKVTDEEVQRGLKRIRAEQYPAEGEFQKLLASRRRTLSQELFIVRMDLLGQKVEQRLRKGGTQLSATFVRDAKSAAASASCRPEYMVEYCKGYKTPKTVATSNTGSSSVLLEEIARWRPETSHGFTGVPVT